jgi:hypothetical protein
VAGIGAEVAGIGAEVAGTGAEVGADTIGVADGAGDGLGVGVLAVLARCQV